MRVTTGRGLPQSVFFKNGLDFHPLQTLDFSSSTDCQAFNLTMEANVNNPNSTDNLDNPNLTDESNLVVKASLSSATDYLDDENMTSSSDLNVEAKLNNPSSDDNPGNPDTACSSNLNVAANPVPNTASNIPNIAGES